MILLDSDVMIDLLRQHLPAMKWFDALDDEEAGYVVMELIVLVKHFHQQCPDTERYKKDSVSPRIV